MRRLLFAVWLLIFLSLQRGFAQEFTSHPPMRRLPESSGLPRGDGPGRFVDGQNGDDADNGSEDAPWKTLKHSLRKIRPGETLYLRGGVYYEKASLTRSGTEGAPITIRSFPGELAVIDGGLPEFTADPATAWEPLPGGADGEFVSTRT